MRGPLPVTGPVATCAGLPVRTEDRVMTGSCLPRAEKHAPAERAIRSLMATQAAAAAALYA